MTLGLRPPALLRLGTRAREPAYPRAFRVAIDTAQPRLQPRSSGYPGARAPLRNLGRFRGFSGRIRQQIASRHQRTLAGETRRLDEVATADRSSARVPACIRPRQGRPVPSDVRGSRRELKHARVWGRVTSGRTPDRAWTRA